MPTETKTDKPETKPSEFTPRRLKLIVGGARGKYLVDADTGEDLRLPIMSLNAEPFGQQANVDVTFVVVGVERGER
jgi:hypothetical protein